MVATDVASRGIGMNKQQPLPLPFLSVHLVLYLLPLPSCVTWCALSFRCAICPGFCVLLGPSSRSPGNLCSLPRLSLLTSTSASSDTSRLWDIILTRSSCCKSRVSKFQRTVDHCRFPGHGHWPPKHDDPSRRESEIHLRSHDHIWSPTLRKNFIGELLTCSSRCPRHYSCLQLRLPKQL